MFFKSKRGDFGLKSSSVYSAQYPVSDGDTITTSAEAEVATTDMTVTHALVAAIKPIPDTIYMRYETATSYTPL